jgi:poly(A) polymerase
VLYRLKSADYDAYLVGGGVRDLLLGREPKDFDIATNAKPEEIKQLFRNCRLIGRRFRLVHVHFGQEIIEVATFRAPYDAEESEERYIKNGMIVRDNVYGTIEQDAWRRDFSVNALYYNIQDFSVLDYTGGLKDLESGNLRIIGDPQVRFREDPVRMLRAVRFAAKLGFNIDPETEQCMREMGDLLDAVPPARLFDECLKLFLSGFGLQTFELLRHHHLFEHLFPEVEKNLGRENEGFPLNIIIQGLKNTDQRIAEDKPVTPAFLFAILLWGLVCRVAEQERARGANPYESIQRAVAMVSSDLIGNVSIPRRFLTRTKEIWTMQLRLEHRTGKRPLHIVKHPRFRAAYDFLLLRAQSGEPLQELGDWWTQFQESGEQEQLGMLKALRSPTKPRRRKRGKRSSTAQKNRPSNFTNDI